MSRSRLSALWAMFVGLFRRSRAEAREDHRHHAPEALLPATAPGQTWRESPSPWAGYYFRTPPHKLRRLRRRGGKV